MTQEYPAAEHAALAWLSRRHSGRWSAADAQAHAAWLADDARHPAAWLRAQGMWEQLAGLGALAEAELCAARAPARRGALGWRAGAVLATACAGIVIAVAFLLPGSFDGTQTYQTARGERRSLTLADGSHLDLNTATRVEVDYGARCRCLRLIGGEAVVRVAHGDLRAFEVRAGDSRIRDLGTEFWLRRDTDRLSVAVLEGAVEISPAADAAVTHLNAGERIALDPAGRLLDQGTAPLADLTAWRQGDIVFRDAPLPDVLREFARYHDFNAELDNRLSVYRLSGRFASNDLEGLLNLLQSAYPISVQRPTADRLRLQSKR